MFKCLEGLGVDIKTKQQEDVREWKIKTKKKKKKKKTIKVITHVKKSQYRAYLKSIWWSSRRLKYWKKHDKICFCCGEQAIDLHHCNYSTLFRERDKDLIPLCRKCHEVIHKEIRKNSNIKLINAHIILARGRVVILKNNNLIKTI